MNILSTIDPVSYDAALGDAVPDHLRDGIHRYVVHGIRPGKFLQAVLQNDLFHGVGMAADPLNIDHMRSITRFVFWCLPGECHGSEEKVAAWIAKGGMQAVAA